MLSVSYAVPQSKSSIGTKRSRRWSLFRLPGSLGKQAFVFNQLAKYEAIVFLCSSLIWELRTFMACLTDCPSLHRQTDVSPPFVSLYPRDAARGFSDRSRSAPGPAPFGRCEHRPAPSGSGH